MVCVPQTSIIRQGSSLAGSDWKRSIIFSQVFMMEEYNITGQELHAGSALMNV